MLFYIKNSISIVAMTKVGASKFKNNCLKVFKKNGSDFFPSTFSELVHLGGKHTEIVTFMLSNDSALLFLH